MEQSAGRLRQSTIPLYRQILEGIKQKIEAGELKAGDRLPSEQELMEHYQVSRRTVRTAVDELCGQGCLVRTGCWPARRAEPRRRNSSSLALLPGRGCCRRSACLRRTQNP